jgi:predicted nucleotidyltransferase
MQTHTNKSKNFILDTSRVYGAMKAKGFSTFDSLANELGVHRNTLLPYFTGQRGLPDCLDRLLNLLDLTPAEALGKNLTVKHQPALDIAPLLSLLVQQAPDCAFVLFGSRARGDHRKHSDYDTGVFRREDLPFNLFSPLIDLCEDWKKEKQYDVNVTNLTVADYIFLKEISRDWVFLGGDLLSWIELQKKAGIELYE